MQNEIRVSWKGRPQHKEIDKGLPEAALEIIAQAHIMPKRDYRAYSGLMKRLHWIQLTKDQRDQTERRIIEILKV